MWVEGAGVDDFVYDDFQEGSEDCGEPGRLGCRCFGWMDGYGSIMIVHVDVKRLILRFSNRTFWDRFVTQSSRCINGTPGIDFR